MTPAPTPPHIETLGPDATTGDHPLTALHPVHRRRRLRYREPIPNRETGGFSRARV